MIRSISIKNLLSFGDPGVTLVLKPLNVLIGANGSGKSNLIDAISLLQAAPRDIAEPLRSGGGGHAWIHKGTSYPEAELVVSVEVSTTGPMALLVTVQHGLRLYLGSSLELMEESLGKEINGSIERVFEAGASGAKVFRRGRENVDPSEGVSYEFDSSVLNQLRGHSALREVIGIARHYESIRIYRDWSFGRKTPLRAPQRADEKNDHLADDASNLGLILSRFRNNSRAKKQLLSELKNFMDGVVDFNVLVEGGTVQLFLEEFDRTIPATRLSDGTLRYLALLAILCDPTPPRLVCIEEPELGLHPDILPNIARLMVEASARTQLIVTTHSDVIVDALTEHPDAIVVCERGEDGSRMQRLDPEALKPWLNNYRLGQLWSKGEIGGNRW